MKKYLLSFGALVLAVMGMTFASCGDDNDEPYASGSIVGTWELDDHWFDSTGNYEGFYESSKGYTKFNKDNTYVSVSDLVLTDEWAEISGEQKHQIEIDRGTYSISGNKCTMNSYTEGESLPFTFEVKGDKIKVIALGLTFTFTRVSDSVINKYLD